MNQQGHISAGIDVSARTLAVAFRRFGTDAITTEEFANDEAGHRSLVRFLEAHRLPVRVCLEWTGTYSLDVALALHERPTIEVMMVNPRKSKDFVKARGVRAKTDAADARSLVDYLDAMGFERWCPPPVVLRRLRDLIRYANDLTEDRTRLKNQLHAWQSTETSSSYVLASLERRIRELDEEIEHCLQEAHQLVCSDEEIAAHVENITTIKGVGARTALAMMAELSLLPADATGHQAAAFLGLDPKTIESGTSVRGSRSISKRGNPRARGTLFMVAMAVARHEPAFKEFYDRLVARGKKPKVALIAVMRRLVVTIWTLIRTKRPFDPDLFRPRKPCAP